MNKLVHCITLLSSTKENLTYLFTLSKDDSHLSPAVTTNNGEGLEKQSDELQKILG